MVGMCSLEKQCGLNPLKVFMSVSLDRSNCFISSFFLNLMVFTKHFEGSLAQR